jgi:RHS repeat-associated protein
MKTKALYKQFRHLFLSLTLLGLVWYSAVGLMAAQSIQGGNSWKKNFEEPETVTVRFQGKLTGTNLLGISLNGVAMHVMNTDGSIKETSISSVDLRPDEIYHLYVAKAGANSVLSAAECSLLEVANSTPKLTSGRNKGRFEQDYAIFIWSTNHIIGEWNSQTMGWDYRYVEGWERYCGSSKPTWETDGTNYYGCDWKIQVRRARGDSDSVWNTSDMDATAVAGDGEPVTIKGGKDSDPAVTDIQWGIDLGLIWSGAPAGKVRYLAKRLNAQAFSPASLEYTEITGDTNEVSVKYGYITTETNIIDYIEQIKTPQMLMNAETLTTNSFKFSFYTPSMVGMRDQDGYFTLVADAKPYVVWMIDSPDGTTNQWRRREIRNDTTNITTLIYNKTNLWTLTQGSGNEARIETRTITTNIVNDVTNRIETQEVRSGASVVSDRTTEVYQKFPWGYEIVAVTNAPGTANLVTTFGYSTNSDSYDYRQLVFAQYPDGYWERRVYADLNVYLNSYPIGYNVPPGSLWRIIQPWKDSSTNAALTDSIVTQYSYTQVDQAKRNCEVGTYRYEKIYGNDGYWTNPYIPVSLLSLYSEETLYVDDECSGEIMYEIKDHGYQNEAYGGDDEYSLGKWGHYYGRLSGQRYSMVRGLSDIVSYDYQFGRWDSTSMTFNVSLVNTNDVKCVSYHGSYGDSGDYLYSGDSGMTFYGLYLDPFKSTKEIKIISGGNLVEHETYIYTGDYANYALIDQVFYERDCLGHATNVYRKDPDTLQIRTIYKADWTGTNTWPSDLKQSTTDESDTKILLAYDSLKRIKTQTKQGAAISGYPNQSDVMTSLSYDAAGRILTNTVSSGSLTQTTISSYDYAGRLLSRTTPDMLTTSYAYSDGGRQTNITYSSGATMITRNYLDRRIASITGTAVTNQFYDYSVNDWDKDEGMYSTYSINDGFGPSDDTKITSGTTNALRWEQKIKDRRGQLVEDKKPAYLSTNCMSIWYMIGFCSQPEFIRRSGFESANGTVGYWFTKYEYDVYRQKMLEYTSDGNYARTPADTNRMSSNTWYYAVNGAGHWMKVSEQYSFLTNNDATPTLIQATKERLTGFGSNEISETIAYDAYTNATSTNITVDFTKKKITQTVDVPNSVQNAVQVTINGLLQTETTPSISNPSWHYYDALGREIAIKGPLGFISGIKYSDTTGQVIGKTNQMGQVTTYQYYAAGQPNAGLLYCETGPTGKNVFYNYNDRGQLVQKWGDVPYPEQRLYSQFGELTNLCTYRGGSAWSGSAWPTNNTGQADVTQWFYDEPTGLLIRKTDAAGNSVVYSYYNNHMLKTRTWACAGSVTTTNIYETTTGDLLTVAYSDGTTNVDYSNYDRRGLPCQVADARGTITLEYDLMGRLTAERCIDGDFSGITVVDHFNTVYGKDYVQVQVTGQATSEYDYGYDSYGRLSSASYGVYSAAYAYAPNSDLLRTTTSKNNSTTELVATKGWEYGVRLQSIQNKAGNSIVSSHVYAYDALNRRTRATQQDSSAWVYGYNNRDELASGNRFWSDSSPVSGQQFGYVFDNIGNRTNAMIGGDINGNNQRTISYTPNNLNEYSTVVTPGYKDVMGAAWTTNVLTVNGGATDRKGEYFHKELSIANGSGPVWQSIQVTNNGVQVTNGYVLFPKYSQSQTNDYDGNLTGDGLWTYTWDAENRLTKVESVSSLPNAAKRRLEFGYDHQGRRIWSKISTNNGSYVVSRNTRFVYDGWNLVAELNATNNAPQRTYLWGNDLSGTLDGAGGIGGLVAIRDHGAGTYHFTCYDGNGNVMALVNAGDQSISAQYEYSPFGELIRATGPMARANPFRFSTKYWDEETGLVYYGYRYYSPMLGRWIGRDTIEEQGGNNLYAFVGNDAVCWIDARGQAAMLDTLFANSEDIVEKASELKRGDSLVRRVQDVVDKLNNIEDFKAGVMEAENWMGSDMTSMLLRVNEAQGAIAQNIRGGKSGETALHHIFPQAEKFANFFNDAGINKHAIRVQLDTKVHYAIHGNAGGPWNNIWGDFSKKYNIDNRPFFAAGFGFGLTLRIGQGAAEVF